MTFVFDIDKTIAATGYLCAKNNESVDVHVLLRALYWADRKAIVEWHRSITGDALFSMDKGPILSHTYDLIRWKVLDADMMKWKLFFSKREEKKIRLLQSTNQDCFSDREIEALDEAVEAMNKKSFVSNPHYQMPAEWQDPGVASLPIDPATILWQELGDHNRVAAIEQELKSVQAAKAALQATPKK